MSELSVTVMREIQAPKEQVFNAWLDPEMLKKFMKPMDAISIPKAEVNAVEGGRFDIVMLGENEMPHGGEYQVIDRFTKIVFTWESAYSVDGSTVTLNFSGDESRTKLELIHTRFLNEEMRNNHEGGWTNILKWLDEALT